jgi:hypothetical protein
MLRPEQRRDRDIRIFDEAIGRVAELSVDRGRIADDADPSS